MHKHNTQILNLVSISSPSSGSVSFVPRSSTLSIPDVKANEPTGDGGSGAAMFGSQSKFHPKPTPLLANGREFLVTDLVAAARALAAGAPFYR
jgi:hypothetical protein